MYPLEARISALETFSVTFILYINAVSFSFILKIKNVVYLLSFNNYSCQDMDDIIILPGY